MDNIRLAAVCTSSLCGEPEQNLKNILSWVQRAKQERANFVLFPEVSITGYDWTDINFWQAERIDGESVTALIESAKEHDLFISAGLLEKEVTGAVYNTHVIVGPEGLVGAYRKSHMPVEEFPLTGMGSNFPVFQARIGQEITTFGISICYDNCFPEPSRIMALKGMDVLLSPFAFSMGKWESDADIKNQVIAQDKWKKQVTKYMAARAHDNTVYAVVCVCSGHVKGLQGKRDYYFPGVCMVFDPAGDLIAETPSDGVKEQMLVTDLLFFKREEQKKGSYFPLKYRRPELYGDLSKLP
nr:nitrilase-related carbon-nitrogen hydrolase [Candidatus Sigynarchaeota archaeon]